MERQHEFEIARRSISLLGGGSQALGIAEALTLMAQVGSLAAQLDRVRAGLEARLGAASVPESDAGAAGWPPGLDGGRGVATP